MATKAIERICIKIKPIRGIDQVKIKLPNSLIGGSVIVTSNVKTIGTFSIKKMSGKSYVIIPIPNREVPDGLELTIAYSIFEAIK